jgi:hypothetical protein
MNTQISTKALHAGHDAKKTHKEHRLFLYIRPHLMFLKTLITQQIYFH